MKRTTNVRKHAVIREDRADGATILRSSHALGPVVATTGDWLDRWAAEAPERVFLAERSGAGWRTVTYGAALEQVRALGQALLGRGLDASRPVAVLSGNGVDHGLLALAAQYVGVPIVPLAEQYALIEAAHPRLVEAIGLVRPALAYVSDADRIAGALALDALAGIEIVASDPGQQAVTPFAALLQGDATDVASAHAAVGPDTVGKILMTSGSTSSPKGVLTTHRMMCVNQTQLLAGLPFLGENVHRLVDWLPWNHVFGGSHNFNMMLANGGSLYIDEGKPLKGLFERTVENLRLMTGTLTFNVPVGFGMLKEVLEADASLRQRFFEDLDLIFYAGATLPQDIWQSFERMALEVKGEVPLMTSSWGLTETAPASLLQQEPTETAGVVGVPLPGQEIKLIPEADGRYEVRVRGPNVMPGYLDAPEKTAEAFDDEGFFITGDAMSFVDRNDDNKGLRFEGRLSDDFKLNTGTWVRATVLRAELLVCLAPLAADVVMTGHDRAEIGALVFPNRAAMEDAGFAGTAEGGALTCAAMQAEIARRLAARAAGSSGSSTRIARVLVLSEPASLAAGEITAKGNLNFRKVMASRADLLERCYDDADPAVIKL